MRALRYALWPAALAFGLAAAWVGRPELVLLDAATGFLLVFLGLAAWSSRSESRAGPIMAAAGFAWFLGTLWAPAVFLHRGPLAHLLLSYPSGSLSTRLDLVAVGSAYAYAAAYPIVENDYATIAFAFGLVALALRRYLVADGPVRRARLASLTGATAFGLVLALGGAARLADAGDPRTVLFAYDLTVGLIAVVLFADVLRGRWAQGTVTGLVVDLGEPATAGTLRGRLARALGDPALIVGYWLPEQGRYVDEFGRPVDLPAKGEARAVTPLDERGRRIAVLVHDATVLDRNLVSAVSSAARLAVSNARLQAEVRARVAEVDASRRRIVEAADEQRRRLELELRSGAQRRLDRVASLVTDVDLALRRELDAAQAELRELGRGIRPRALTEQGLAAAIRELAKRSSVAIDVEAPSGRFPAAVEAAAYFVCSESLANVAKYSGASRARVRAVVAGEWLTVEVADDGVGGADASRGTGLRGLTDRVEALGGRFELESHAGTGTRLVASLPLSARR